MIPGHRGPIAGSVAERLASFVVQDLIDELRQENG
jgi:hypothetical protein